MVLEEGGEPQKGTRVAALTTLASMLALSENRCKEASARSGKRAGERENAGTKATLG